MEKSFPELQSIPELIVASWLTKNDILFTLQEKFFGGVTQAGGAVVDFVIPERNLVIRVMSYWHEDLEARSRDEMQKIKLTSEGYTVIDIWEEAIMTNLEYTMSEALEGREVGS